MAENKDVKHVNSPEEYRLWLEATTDYTAEEIKRKVDYFIEQIQANNGMSEPAIEADIAAQENPKPDYLDENGNPHWYDEEEETEEPVDMSGYEFAEYIHSQEFIEKFGDWEKANRLENLKNADSLVKNGQIILNDSDITETVESLIQNEDRKGLQAIEKEIGKKVLGTYSNLNTNLLINVSNRNVTEISNHHYLFKEHIQSLAYIPEIIEKAVLIDEMDNEDKTKHPNIQKYLYFGTGIKINDIDYTCKSVVGIDKDNNCYYDQSLSTIEKGRLIDIIQESNKKVSNLSPLITQRETDSLSVNLVASDKDARIKPYEYYDKRLIQICQVPQMPYLEMNPVTGKWQPKQESVELVKKGKLHIEKVGQEYKMVLNGDFINTKNNDILEQSSLDKASEILKGMKFNSENYKKLIKIINEISELNKNDKIQVPPEEQLKKEILENKETESIKLFDPNVPIDFGKTVLPAFAVLANGKLHSVENAVIMSFDKKKQTYLVANSAEKFELPKKTFKSLYLKTKKQNIKENINVAHSTGKAIVFENKENGIRGTVIPEFSMFTQRKLETFKDYVPLKYNQSDDTYTLSNGKSEIKVTAEQFKEITSPERFNNNFDENTPAWKKLCKQQYKDFFELRENTAYNFHHNLAVLCRKEANSPCDAIHLAKRIISNMSKQEQNQTKKMFQSLTKNCSINEMLATIYNNSIKEQPLNEEYIKNYYPNDIIARPFYDVITENGKKIENDPALIKNDTDRNLSIGSFIENININCANIFGKGKSYLHFDKLKVIAASKENNTITVMDSKKSYIKLPRDTVLNVYKTQQINEMKKEQHRKNNTINVSSYA